MTLIEHIRLQRRNLLKVVQYGLEGTVLCFAGVWFLYDNMSLEGRLLASALFGGGVMLIGFVMVLALTRSIAHKAKQPDADDQTD